MRFLRSGRVPLVALFAVVVTALAVLPAGATVAGTSGQIAFARQLPAGGADVFIANPDGGHARQVPLVYPAEDFGIPRWSPDGSQLLISHVLRFDASGNLLPFAGNREPGRVQLQPARAPERPVRHGLLRRLVPEQHPAAVRLRR